MDAPPIPRLVDLVHVFTGLVVEQFKKGLEELLSDSILLWRLLKLLFKILQWRSFVGSSLFCFLLLSLSSILFVFPVIPLSVVLWFFFPMQSDEDKTPQQQQEEGDTHTGGEKKCSSKSDSLFLLSDFSRKTEKRQARCKLYEIQCELQKLKMEADDDLEKSDVAENFCRSKSTAVYQECPIKPENFLGTIFNSWEQWVKHYKSVVKANGWSDMQAIEALPACLTTWAVEEFETVPRHYVEKILEGKTPQFDALLAVLEPKMQQYRSNRAAWSEFKAVKQMENESLKDYFRRVRLLGDLALSEKSLTEKDQDLRDQFLEGLLNNRLQQKLYEDETDRNFCEVLYRVQELELIQKSSEEKGRQLL